MIGIDYIENAITFKSYNPYKARYPGIKVLPRLAINIIKELRSDGQNVIVLPNNDEEVKYIVHKGPWDFLNDPLVISFGEHLFDIVKSIIAGNLYYEFRNGRANDPTKNDSSILLQSEGEYYSHSGDVLNQKDWKNRLAVYQEIEKVYSNLVEAGSPYSEYPWPVFYEHTARHIGWSNAFEDEKGLQMIGKIFDEDILSRIEKRELKGASFTGIVNKSTCSICSKNYVYCNHLSGKTYSNIECINHIHEIDLCCLNIVSKPVHPKANINIKIAPAN